ncbi:MAG: hypothetical protein EAZ55_08620 [Cytophagales bacterium]|nr:MAG: hypothetical protein EAZ55_08620 [Cytophagales bacterium]
MTKRHNILVLNNNAQELNVLFNILNPFYDVLSADKTSIFKEIFQKKDVSIIIIDWQTIVPELEDILHFLQQSRLIKITPCMIVAEASEISNNEEIIQKNANVWLEKPLQSSKLLSEISSLLMASAQRTLKNNYAEEMVAQEKSIQNKLLHIETELKNIQFEKEYLKIEKEKIEKLKVEKVPKNTFHYKIKYSGKGVKSKIKQYKEKIERLENQLKNYQTDISVKKHLYALQENKPITESTHAQNDLIVALLPESLRLIMLEDTNSQAQYLQNAISLLVYTSEEDKIALDNVVSLLKQSINEGVEFEFVKGYENVYSFLLSTKIAHHTLISKLSALLAQHHKTLGFQLQKGNLVIGNTAQKNFVYDIWGDMLMPYKSTLVGNLIINENYFYSLAESVFKEEVFDMVLNKKGDWLHLFKIG